MPAGIAVQKLMPGIQALRFFAALGVFIHHAFAYADWFKAIPPGYLEQSRIFAGGVIVFFVLSGFLMAKISAEAEPLRFLFDRLLRIYPGFWLALAVFALLGIVVGLPQAPQDWASVLTLAPSGNTVFPLRVEWTLVYEVFFYVVVMLLCLAPSLRLRQTLVAIWLLAILAAGSADPLLPPFPAIALSYLNIAFIAGMGAWWLRNRIPLRGVAGMLLGLGIFAGSEFIGGGPLGLGWLSVYVLKSLGSAALVIAASRATAFEEKSPWVRLGDASYGLYLIHATVLVALLYAVPGTGWLYLACISALALSASIAFGLVEHLMHKMLALKRHGVKRLARPA